MDAAIAALLGTALGAIGSVGGAWLQQRHQTRRERVKLAAELGRADYEVVLQLAKSRSGGSAVPPMSMFISYHLEALKAMEEDDFTPQRIAEIEEHQQQLGKAFPRRF